MSPITVDIPVPARSRTFTPEDAAAAFRALTGVKLVTDDDGNPVLGEDGKPTTEPTEPAKRIGFGEFKTAGAARSAGVSLNRLLLGLGAPHAYSVSTFEEADDKHIGVMYNKPAKTRKTDENGDTPAADTTADTPPKRGGRARS